MGHGEIDGPSVPDPEAPVQANGRHVQQEVHGDHEPAGKEGGHQGAEGKFLRDAPGADGDAAPHEAAEKGKLIGRRTDHDVKGVAVMVNVRQSNGQKLQGEARQGGGKKQAPFFPVSFAHHVENKHGRNDVAHDLKAVDPNHAFPFLNREEPETPDSPQIHRNQCFSI